jgi:hypothetical protein
MELRRIGKYFLVFATDRQDLPTLAGRQVAETAVSVAAWKLLKRSLAVDRMNARAKCV